MFRVFKHTSRGWELYFKSTAQIPHEGVQDEDLEEACKLCQAVSEENIGIVFSVYDIMRSPHEAAIFVAGIRYSPPSWVIEQMLAGGVENVESAT